MAKRRVILSYDSVVTRVRRPPTMLASLVLPNAVAPRAARAALARPRRSAPAASRPLRHVARAAAGDYVNPLRPGETESQAAERRQREANRVSERTKVRPPYRAHCLATWHRKSRCVVRACIGARIAPLRSLRPPLLPRALSPNRRQEHSTCAMTAAPLPLWHPRLARLHAPMEPPAPAALRRARAFFLAWKLTLRPSAARHLSRRAGRRAGACAQGRPGDSVG